jgi:Rrf2 family protein
LEITQQADYAVRAVLELALRSNDELVSSEEVARRQNVPAAFLTKIFARLAAEEIVLTQRGVNGGVRLARPAAEITLLQVVEAIDGPITLNRCNRNPSECPRDSFCAVHPIWFSLCAELRARLSGIHFAELAASAQSRVRVKRSRSALQLEGVTIASNQV